MNPIVIHDSFLILDHELLGNPSALLHRGYNFTVVEDNGFLSLGHEILYVQDY